MLNRPQDKFCDVMSPAVAQCISCRYEFTAKMYNNNERRRNKKKQLDSIVIYGYYLLELKQ